MYLPFCVSCPTFATTTVVTEARSNKESGHSKHKHPAIDFQLGLRFQFLSASENDNMEADEDDEGPIKSVLNNPLVLRRIFTHLTTAELISSCSFLDKCWNFQARTYVRNHRTDCQAYLSSKSNPSNCSPYIRLREFVDTLTHMSVVPFSYIYLVLRCHNLDDNALEFEEYSHKAPTVEIIVSKMRLKKLPRYPAQRLQNEFRKKSNV